MRVRGVLAGVGLAVVLGAPPAPAASQFETVFLSGPSGVFAPLPTPVGRSTVSREAVTEDGRWVAFRSSSNELMDGDDDTVANAYVRDTQNGQLFALNTTEGGEPGHGDVQTVAIEDDEATPPRVAILTEAQLSPIDTDSDPDVYVRDLTAGTVELVSRASGDAPNLPGHIQDMTISGNGAVVAWSTDAALDPGDTVPDSTDVYTRNLSSDLTTWQSRREGTGLPTTGLAGATAYASQPSLSPAGDAIVFETTATDIDAQVADTNGVDDTYLRQLSDGDTQLISAVNGTATTEGTGGGSRGGVLRGTGPGWIVYFASDAGDLAAADADTSTDVFRRVVGSTATEMVSLNDADAPTTSQVFVSDASSGGTRILMRSFNSDLFAPDANGDGADMILRVRTGPGAGTTRLVSRGDGAAGAQSSGDSNGGSLSADGSWLAYQTDSPELAPGAQRLRPQVLRRGLTGAELNTPISSGPATPLENPGGLGQIAGRHAVSADGRYVLFRANGAGISDQDQAGDLLTELYRRDVLTGDTVLVSRADGSGGTPAETDVSLGAISDDGNRAVWVQNPADGFPRSVFVRDIAAQTTTRVSRKADGTPDDVVTSGDVAISGDGRRVAWVTASDLTGSGEGGGNDVFVRDLASDVVYQASRADAADGADADGSSGSPALDATGNRIAFSSSAANLGNGDTDTQSDVHVRDLAAGRTTLVSRSTGGQKSDSLSATPSLSADGRFVAFASYASNLVPGTPDNVTSVYVHDTVERTTILVNRESPSGPRLEGTAGNAVLSDDGRSVAWIQDSSQAMVRALDGAAEVASRATGAGGAVGNRDSARVSLDADASCVVFDSYSTNLIAAPVPGEVSTAFLRVRGAACPDPAAAPGPGSTPPPAGTTDTVAPVISRLRLSNARFRVGAKPTAVLAAQRRPAPRGTKVRFTLSETARVTLTIQRRALGRRVGKRCRKATPALRKRKRCLRYVRVGVLTRRSVPAGARSIAFSGRVGTKALRPARYRLVAGARDGAGNKAKVSRVAFRVVRR